MKSTSKNNTVFGLIEHRNRTIAAYVPCHLLIFDALSYAKNRVVYFRAESEDFRWTAVQRGDYAARADFLAQWIREGATAAVPSHVDSNLFSRTNHLPAVVDFSSIDGYLDAVLSASDIVPFGEANAPQFSIRNLESCLELSLTDNIWLHNAKHFPGPHTQVIETTSHKIIGLALIQDAMKDFDFMDDIAVTA